MDLKEKHEWARHYDALFWTVATIMSTAIGGLLLFLISAKFDLVLALITINLIILTVYFTASFRELRFIFQDIENDDIKRVIEEREFLQWWPYLFIFLFLCVIWVKLLWEHIPEGKIYWLIIGIINFIFIISLGIRTNGKNLRERIKNIRGKKKFNKLQRHFWLFIIIIIIILEVVFITAFRYQWIQYLINLVCSRAH